MHIRGRTTPIGVGILHDTHDGVRTKCEIGNGSEGGEFSVEREFISTELAVLDVRRGSSDCPQFSKKGDSGAPVRLADGSVIGFVLVSDGMEAAPVSYVAMGETVMESIRNVMGAKEVCFVGREVREVWEDGHATSRLEGCLG